MLCISALLSIIIFPTELCFAMTSHNERWCDEKRGFWCEKQVDAKSLKVDYKP